MPLTSGRLAGLLRVRDEIVPNVRFQLDEFAKGLVRAFSEGGSASESNMPVLQGLFVLQGHESASLLDHVPNAARLITVNSNVDPELGGASTFSGTVGYLIQRTRGTRIIRKAILDIRRACWITYLVLGLPIAFNVVRFSIAGFHRRVLGANHRCDGITAC